MADTIMPSQSDIRMLAASLSPGLGSLDRAIDVIARAFKDGDDIEREMLEQIIEIAVGAGSRSGRAESIVRDVAIKLCVCNMQRVAIQFPDALVCQLVLSAALLGEGVAYGLTDGGVVGDIQRDSLFKQLVAAKSDCHLIARCLRQLRGGGLVGDEEYEWIMHNMIKYIITLFGV
jgi:hypothetical protein